MIDTRNDIREKVNAATHCIGFTLSLVAVAFLIPHAIRLPFRDLIACGVYSLALVQMYAISTLSHAVHEPSWRRRWRTLDQACIFVLIASSYTPFGVIYLLHDRWWLLLVIMWFFASLGVLRVLYVKDLPTRDKFAFGVLGLIPSIALGEISIHAPPGVVPLVIAGGACYLIGTIFLGLDSKLRFAHACWHLFVISGSTLHYFAVLKAVS